jgi:hypothetical protein
VLRIVAAPASDGTGLLPRIATRRRARQGTSALAALALPLLLLGCTAKPSVTATSTNPKPQQPLYPARPSVSPPAFKVFHHDASSITVVTKEDASDEEIEALIWQLRGAAHAHTFDQLKIPQQLVDKRDHKIWFHIYRGSKCASEKYASGPPPCGGSYHAAGDYTFGSYTSPEADNGALLRGEDHETELWDPDAPYHATPPNPS